MRILFAGSPDIALPSLRKINERFDICAVLTKTDRFSGRGKKIQPPPVKELAGELSLPVLQPIKLNTAAREEIAAYKPDILVVFAYGKIFGPVFLSLFPLGGINLHPSLLPRHRGPSPMVAAILSGDNKTGVTVQEISLEMDAGDIVLQEEFPLSGKEKRPDLEEKAAELGADALSRALEQIDSGTVERREQNDDEATYCHLIKKEDGLIDWNMDTFSIERMTRAFVPWPTAYTTLDDISLAVLEAEALTDEEAFDKMADFAGTPSPGTVLGIDKARGILVQTGDGILAIKKLRLQAKKALDWKSFINGYGDLRGTLLGAD